jgi:hypothetical protein
VMASTSLSMFMPISNATAAATGAAMAVMATKLCRAGNAG